MIVSANVSSGVFDLKLSDREITVNCNRMSDCRDFSEADIVKFELQEMGVTMTGGQYTVIYKNLGAGGFCAGKDNMETPFFVKAKNSVKVIDDGYLNGVKGKCPLNGVWLDGNLFGEITDARQVVLFNSNRKDAHWRFERITAFKKNTMSEFESLNNNQKEYAELHLN